MSIGTLTAAGLVATGVLVFPLAATAQDEAVKRDEDTSDVVLQDDDDDDDDDTTGVTTATTATAGTTSGATSATDTGSAPGTNGTGTGTNTNTATTSGDQNDQTASNLTDVSLDQDASRGDVSKDFTADGPGEDNRDDSANQTNDASRHDTRG